MYDIHTQMLVDRHVMCILILSEWNKNCVSIHFNTKFNGNLLSHSVVVAFGYADGRTDRETDEANRCVFASLRSEHTENKERENLCDIAYQVFLRLYRHGRPQDA